MQLISTKKCLVLKSVIQFVDISKQELNRLWQSSRSNVITVNQGGMHDFDNSPVISFCGTLV